MKRSLWLGYAIAPFTGPFLYCVIAIFIPEITNSKEYSVETWFFSLFFFSIFSYIVCFIYGSPLVYALVKHNKLSLLWFILPSSVLYAISIFIALFYILGGEITGNLSTVIGYTLFIGLGLGLLVSVTFCAVVGISQKPYAYIKS